MREQEKSERLNGRTETTRIQRGAARNTDGRGIEGGQELWPNGRIIRHKRRQRAYIIIGGGSGRSRHNTEFDLITIAINELLY